MTGKRKPKTSSRQVRTALRRGEIIRLRDQGYTYDEIGRRVGISAVAAYKHVKAALELAAKDLAESVDEVRIQELRRLDRATVKVMKKIDGKGDALSAIDRLVKIQERRAKFLGLDAPAQLEHGVTSGPLKAPVVLLPEPDKEPTDPPALPDASSTSA
jgi:predicted DNA-binding protein (UPF0251 family)